MIVAVFHSALTSQDMLPLHFFFVSNKRYFVLAAILDIAFTWKARSTMEFSQKMKLLMRMAFAAIWTIVLPVCYAKSRRKYTCYSAKYGSWLGEWCFSSYMVAAAIYLISNAVDTVLFFVPVVSKYIEVSNWRICAILSWWTQVSSS